MVYILDLAGYAVDVCLGRDACLLCEILYLLTVLIGTGAEENILAHLALEAREGVGHNDLVGVAEMRLTRSVCNRCG